MGCNTDNNEDFGGGSDSAGHCNTWTPPSGSGVTMTVDTYPSRNQYNLNWPDVDRDRVMYDSFIRTGDVPTRESCGKEKKLIDTIFGLVGRPGAGGAGSANTPVYRVYQHVPKELSLYPIDSDMWFRIQYDTADYFVGTPCKRFEVIDRTDSWPQITETSSSPGAPDPETGAPTTNTTTTVVQESGTVGSVEYKCIPCTASETPGCNPVTTTINYSSPDGNISGDSKNPYPTIWAVDTNSRYIVFEYDQLSTTVPNTIRSFELTHATITTTMWEDNASAGQFDSPVGNWDQDDGSTNIFVVIDDDISTGSILTGDAARMTLRIRPNITDLTNDVYTFDGSFIDVIELANPGTGYSVGQTFPFSHTFNHEGGGTTTWEFVMTITDVGSITAPTGSTLALISAGDQINGHTVVRALHTDPQNFSHQVLELDGSGSAFQKDTQYSSSRNHNITVSAGFGITDRATLIGLYEFRNKNIQYITKFLNPDRPHYYDDIEQIEVEPTINNGRLTGVNIVSGGKGLDNLDREPEVVVSPPPVKNGRQAKVKGSFSGGVLTGLEIIDRGSGYSNGEYSKPTIGISDFDDHRETILYESNISKGNLVDSYYDEVENDAFIDENIDSPTYGEKISDGIGKEIYGSAERQNQNLKQEGFDDVKRADPQEKVVDIYEVSYFRPKEFFVGETAETVITLADGSTQTIGKKSKKLKSPTRNTEYKFFSNGKDARDFMKKMEARNYKAKLNTYLGILRSEYYDILSDRLEDAKTGRGFGKTMTDGKEVPYTKADREKIRFDRYENLESEERLGIENTTKFSRNRRADQLSRSKFKKETVEQFPRPKDDTNDIFKHISGENQSQTFPQQFSDAQKTEATKGDVINSAQVYQNQLDGLDTFYAEDLTFDEERDEDNFFREREVEVRTVESSFQRLPCASRFVKYQIRQYVPDNREKTQLSISLNVTTANAPDCAVPCGSLGGILPTGGVPLVDFDQVTIAYAFNNTDIYGGCSGFSANGVLDIYNDFSASAALFTTACEIMGNPFPSICDNQ
ncbi:hypothetical protein LIS021110_082 [Cyanophage S-RIM14]|uniref:Uncharacterized protein n=1 Tax=Cyanophage S-RIM14 TaxID=1278423 RepID=A0A1D7SHK3_9CAUD|nr:hypothetical protein LIS021110_082 [Cyanophage S-RIM14]